jgi:hypothetical protein
MIRYSMIMGGYSGVQGIDSMENALTYPAFPAA